MAAQPLVHQLHHAHAGCLVVHKPPAVPFHATADHPGLLQLIRRQQGQAHLPYSGPLWAVHRLDSIASGALVLATSCEAAGELVAAFRGRRVHKYYVALSDRRPSKKMGSVVGDMQRGRRGSWLLARSTHNPAVTRFTTAAVAAVPQAASAVTAPPPSAQAAAAAVAAVEAGASRQQHPHPRSLRAFLLKPETGRTHQLRVAMKSLGAPVLGDERYAQANAAAREDRGYLHCAALRFELRGQAVQVVCPPAHGAEFVTPHFQQLFATWFPPGLEANEGVWFPDSKLLRSELANGQYSPAAAAVAAAVPLADEVWESEEGLGITQV